MNRLAKKIIAVVISATMLPLQGNFMGEHIAYADTTDVVTLIPEESPFNNGRFEGWGTSLCWWANRLGYSEALTRQSAELFFSDDGLGLDIGRYNIGGGDDPTHNHITRSDSKIPGYATGFANDGSIIYDWTADENQRNIVLAALDANPELHVEGFSNSPPYFMTNSGCSTGAVRATNDNLKSDQYENFAEYIAECTRHFKEEFGITFSSYSPMNEPDSDYWAANSNKQEGCHFSPGDSESKMLIATREALDEKGLDDVIVAGMDETSIDVQLANLDKLSDEAQNALGRIDTHTYGGTKRAELKAKAVEMGKTLWMSEVDNGGTAGTNPGNMGAGLNLANRILADMNGMQPAAWVLWNIIDVHKDSNFYYTDSTGNKVYSERNNSLNQNSGLWGVGLGNHDTQTIELTQKYYVFGQFTKYIVPGDTIILSSDKQTLVAYNKDTGSIKIVAVNTSGSRVNKTYDMSCFTETGDTVQIIRTSGAFNGGEQWAELDPVPVSDKKFSYDLPANSVTTFVIENDIDDIGIRYLAIDGPDTLFMEQTAQYTALSSDKDAVIWSVSDDSIAQINEDGLLTPKKGGIITVTATSPSLGLSKSTEVKIFNIRKLSIPASNVTGSAPWSGAPGDVCTKVVDGNLSTYFDGVTGGWVTLDLGGEYEIGAIAYAPRAGYEDRMVSGMFYGSDDNVNWTKLYTVTMQPESGVLTYVYPESFDSGTADMKYRYIKYTVPSGNNYNCNVAEIAIWEQLYGFKEINVSDDGLVTYRISSVDKEINDLFYVALYDEDGILVDISNERYGEFTLPENGNYTISAFLWDENYIPLRSKLQEKIMN